MAPEILQRIVINNLLEVLKYFGLDNDRKEMAKFIDINYATFRTWLSYKRTPSLKTLDKISSNLSIPTYILLLPELSSIDINKYVDKDIKNNSSVLLDKNLIAIYQENGLDSWGAVEIAYKGLLSKETLKSYHRKNNKRTPTIYTLEKMSSYLGTPAYKLIIGG